MGILDSLKNVLGNRGKDGAETPAAETPADGDTGAAPGAPAGNATYTVQSGDTLWRIAKQHYGDGEQYMRIFEANQDVLEHPDRIHPGQVLSIPPQES